MPDKQGKFDTMDSEVGFKALELPENARRELKPGEVFSPIISHDRVIPEVTTRSIVLGTVMAVIFSAAAAFIALKLGQGIETAIPIAILAVGISAVLKRKSTLLENVNILAYGATSGIIVGGATFTLPAIYILGIDPLTSIFQLFFVAFLGGALGVLLLIPFRRYFVKDMHGKLPFPEATATTEILVTGERGGAQTAVLALAGGLGWLYDTLIYTFQGWSETFTTAVVPQLNFFTDKVKAVFLFNGTAAIAGLGYIIGVRYAAIIFAGSFLSWFVLIPFLSWIGFFMDKPLAVAAGLPLLNAMPADEIFRTYVRYIGIGAIFAAGVISIGQMSPVIFDSLRSVFRELWSMVKGKKAALGEIERTDKDIKMSSVFALFIILSAAIWIYFRYSVLKDQANPTSLSFIALIITLLISFLFASVSAMAIAMIGTTPISGMTLMTLILSSVIMVKAGVTGESGMLAVLLIGGVVCTALSMTGTLVTEFKIGYWLGATPKKVQIGNIIGCVASAILVAFVIYLLNSTYGFVSTAQHMKPLPAPQANAMAAVIKSIMVSGSAPWRLYAIGACISIVVALLDVSALAFALGMYIPIDLNAPILAGAIVAHFVIKSSKNEGISKKRNDKGTLIASGLIAGGAIAGVINAVIKYFGEKSESFKGLLGNIQIFKGDAVSTGVLANWLSIIIFGALCIGIYLWSKRGIKEE